MLNDQFFKSTDVCQADVGTAIACIGAGIAMAGVYGFVAHAIVKGREFGPLLMPSRQPLTKKARRNHKAGNGRPEQSH